MSVYLISRKARSNENLWSVEFFRYEEGFQISSFHANNSLHPQVLNATSRTNYKRFVSSALGGSHSWHIININGTTLMLGLPSAIYVAQARLQRTGQRGTRDWMLNIVENVKRSELFDKRYWQQLHWQSLFRWTTPIRSRFT